MEDNGVLNRRRRSATRKGMVIGAWTGVVSTFGVFAVGVIGRSFLFLLPGMPAYYLFKALGYNLGTYHAGVVAQIVLLVLLPTLVNCIVLSLLGALIGFLVSLVEGLIRRLVTNPNGPPEE
jgi:hypothetical protein